ACNTPKRKEKLKSHHMTPLNFEKVKMVMPIVDELRSGGMLEWEPYCKIRAADTNQKKMRELYEVLHSGGDKFKSAFYSQLEMQEPCLFRDLG
uniref:CARD domain-containing protein n=1 Tax=Sinocyclocheilus anshuiensis TaxID=1608454 RepID=A0A671NDU5_9TELE